METHQKTAKFCIRLQQAQNATIEHNVFTPLDI